MAGYLYQRSKGKDVQAAGEFASAIAGKKVETSGPFRGNENEVLDAILLVKRQADKD
jgi:sugar/nucleoside kinase (ribokinase family)